MNTVDFSIASNWNSGFTANLSIANNSVSNLNGWTLEFDAPFAIAEIWDAEIVSRQDSHYVIRNTSWNNTISSNSTASFGFNGSKSSEVVVKPTNFILNGSLLSGGSSVTLPPSSNVDKTIVAGNVGTLPPTSSVQPSIATNVTNANSKGVVAVINNDSLPAGAFNYGEALGKSFLFYEAQRSGKLPSTNHISWRGDSALKDGSDVGVDLTGGYYDAGDHVKFGLPMASSMTMLGWGVVQYRNAYQQSGHLNEALEAIKWGTDYILKAHTAPNEFWGQVGLGNLDHAYWGSPETMTMARPAFKIDAQNPGSDLAGEAAAALASASIAFRPTDSAYADRLLTHATQLFSFADTYRGKYSDSIPDAASFYPSYSYNDELVWSATWLHKAIAAKGETDTFYLDKAQSYYQGVYAGGTQSWDEKSHGAAVLLAQETGNSRYRTDVENWLNYWSDKSGAGIKYTPGGFAWLDQWGSSRYSANTAFIAGIYSDTVNDPGDRYSKFAEGQIKYLLGDNPNNRSYMVGFGNNAPLNPHHRSAHGSTTNNINSPAINRNVLTGALVGGLSAPNDNAYSDDRTNFITNEVALDYNAGFTGSLARMYQESTQPASVLTANTVTPSSTIKGLS